MSRFFGSVFIEKILILKCVKELSTQTRDVTRPLTKMSSSRAVIPIMRALHLRPVKSINFTFDPYAPNIRTTREVMSLLHVPKIKLTKYTVKYVINVKSNRCLPEIGVEYDDGDQLLFKMENLSAADVLKKILFYSELKDVKKEEPSQIAGKMERKTSKRK